MILRMKAELYLYLMAAMLSCCCGQSITVCPPRTQQLISKNRTLLPEENVQASSEDTFNPVENFLMYSSQDPWCTAEEDSSHPGHFIDLNFTEPIVLTYVESDGFTNGYVNNFTIEYTLLPEGDHFNTYRVTDDQQEFYVQGTAGQQLSPARFTLEKVAVARRLRFRINGGVLDPSNRFCWKVLLLGCTFLEAVSIEGDGRVHTASSPYILPTSSPTPLPSSSFSSSSSSSSVTVTPPPAVECSAAPNMLTDQQKMLVIALPTAAGTVIIVFVIVAVMLCVYRFQRRDKNANGFDNAEKVPVEHGPPLPQRLKSPAPLVSSSSSFHYDTPRPLMYDVPRTSRCQSCSTSIMESSKPSGPENEAEVGGNDYEMIPDLTEAHLYSAPPSYTNKGKPSPGPVHTPCGST